jgi:hypothetical protein
LEVYERRTKRPPMHKEAELVGQTVLIGGGAV